MTPLAKFILHTNITFTHNLLYIMSLIVCHSTYSFPFPNALSSQLHIMITCTTKCHQHWHWRDCPTCNTPLPWLQLQLHTQKKPLTASSHHLASRTEQIDNKHKLLSKLLQQLLTFSMANS